ncbi:MAG TPA: DUF2142 domain-containing protein [Acidimicrobiales bacterium]|nr:DUF2142 domain-containing protein [Acidimicrobiales bacterium]
MRPIRENAAARAAARLSARRFFLLSFLVLFGAAAIWSAASPILGGPDERAQVIKAAAVDHGQWTGCFLYAPKLGHCVPDPTKPDSQVKLPQFFALIAASVPHDPSDGPDLACTIHRPTVPASCMNSLDRPPSKRDITDGSILYAHTYVARYPPLYYLAVGLPSRLGGSSIDIYLMRLISAALSALFLALAFTAAFCWSRNRLLVLGLLVAVTPMALYLAGVVNPSGLEIASATAFWTAGTILVTERLSDAPAGLRWLFALSGATFALLRGISPFWVACSLALLALVPRRAALARALRGPRLLLPLAAIAAASLGALAWIIPEHALLQFHGTLHAGVPANVSTFTILANSFGHTRYYLADMVGVFGSFDAYSPLVTFVVWGLLVLGLVLAAMRLGGRRAVVLLALLVVGIILLPVAISSSHAHEYGYNWSGRDTLPLGVGLPILAAGFLGAWSSGEGRERALRRASGALLPLWGVAQFLAFAEALRRNAVGTHGAIVGFITRASWHPAIGILPALLLEIVALAALGGVAAVVGARSTGSPPRSPASP